MKPGGRAMCAQVCGLGWVATVATALLLAAAAPAAAETCNESTGAGCGLSAVYSGSFSATLRRPQQREVQTTTLEWSEHYNGQRWVLDRDSGTVSFSGAGVVPAPCSATLKELPEAAQRYLALQEAGTEAPGGQVPVISHTSPFTGEPNRDTWYVYFGWPQSAAYPASAYPSALLESSEQSPSSPCDGNGDLNVISADWAHESGGLPCNYDSTGEVGIDAMEFPIESSDTVPDECNWSGGPNADEESWQASLRGSLSLSSAIVSPPTQTITPSEPSSQSSSKAKTPEEEAKERLHEQARMDLRRAIARATVACAIEAGKGLYEGLELVASPTDVGELSLQALSPLANAAVDGFLGALGSSPSTACHEAAHEVEQARERYEGDPPDEAYRSVPLPVARVSSAHRAPAAGACAHARGRHAGNCAKLLSAATALAKAVAATGTVEAALTSASNRLATATQADQASAVTLQLASSKALLGELSAALEAQNRAQGALRADLQRDAMQVFVSEVADVKGAASFQAQMAALGAPAALLQGLAGDELDPQKLDLATLLASDAGTSTALGLWRSLTFGELSAIYTSLSSQGQVPSALRSALAADLRAAEAAGSPAVRESKLRAFQAGVAKIKGAAGTLLSYAVKPLV